MKEKGNTEEVEGEGKRRRGVNRLIAKKVIGWIRSKYIICIIHNETPYFAQLLHANNKKEIHTGCVCTHL